MGHKYKSIILFFLFNILCNQSMETQANSPPVQAFYIPWLFFLLLILLWFLYNVEL